MGKQIEVHGALRDTPAWRGLGQCAYQCQRLFALMLHAARIRVPHDVSRPMIELRAAEEGKIEPLPSMLAEDGEIGIARKLPVQVEHQRICDWPRRVARI